jgi:hypothetical protein
MLKLKKPPAGIQLLRWNKKLPSVSTQDPLGLNLRVSNRLAVQLLYCITSITPRARYYSFFPWAFEDYARTEQGKPNDRGRVRAVLARERALVVGSVMHHDGHACAGGALGGSEEAIKLYERGVPASFKPDTFKHLKAREGQFGAAYKASLINLGLFAEETEGVNEEADEGTEELNAETQSIEVQHLSARGMRLADAFQQSVSGTRYIKEGWPSRATIPAAVLKDYGRKAGLCEIDRKGAADREVMREILFACDRQKKDSAHYRRRMTLLLLLQAIAEASGRYISFDRHVFNDLTYFGRIVRDDEEQDDESFPVAIPDPLIDIAARWRIFHFHGYLAVALQSFLVTIVGILREHPSGIERGKLLEQFSPPAVAARFHKLFDLKLPRSFFDMTPRDLLSVAGANVAEILGGQLASLERLGIDSLCSERALSILLVDDRQVMHAGAIALASMLLYILLLRYQVTTERDYDAWYANLVQDPFADISVPGVLGTLRSEYGDGWWDRPNDEILNLVVWRFVVLQHRTMGFDRGGEAPLFHLDGTTLIGAEADFDDPQALNGRFDSAIQILVDLPLVGGSRDDGFSLTAEGVAWLDRLLAEERRA